MVIRRILTFVEFVSLLENVEGQYSGKFAIFRKFHPDEYSASNFGGVLVTYYRGKIKVTHHGEPNEYWKKLLTEVFKK